MAKVFVRDAEIDVKKNGYKAVYSNFSCVEKVTKEGKRYKPTYPEMTVYISQEMADKLADEGFRVTSYVNDDGDTKFKIVVKIRFDNFPPKVYKVVEGRRPVRLDEGMLKDLDKEPLTKLDMTIRLSNGGATYISTAYFTVEEEEIDSLYNWAEEDDYEFDEE